MICDVWYVSYVVCGVVSRVRCVVVCGVLCVLCDRCVVSLLLCVR